jgi:hypothetical protein
MHEYGQPYVPAPVGAEAVIEAEHKLAEARRCRDYWVCQILRKRQEAHYLYLLEAERAS